MEMARSGQAWKACLTVCVAVCLAVAPRPVRAAPHHPATHAARPAKAPPPPQGGWSPASCGREPQAPVVETATIARYNASIDAVTAYDQAARTYNACVSRAATEEQTAISNQAKLRIDSIQQVSTAVQRRIAANFAALSAALKKGPPR